jgi:K+-transporting ATPase ATPase C chain
VANARLQTRRVALARRLDPDEVLNVVAAHTQTRQWGFLGEDSVNVLELNLALDRLGGS